MGPQQGEVYGRFAKAFAALGPIRKEQRNAHHNYAFRGIDDVLNAIHDVLEAQELFYVPRCVGEAYEEWKTSKGGRLQVARLSYEFEFFAPDGSSLVAGPVVGQAADTDDKAPMQALSQAAKPALIHAFCIQTDAPDADAQSPITAAGGRHDEVAPEITQEQLDDIKALVAKLPADELEQIQSKVFAGFHVAAWDELNRTQAENVRTRLAQKVAELEAAKVAQGAAA